MAVCSGVKPAYGREGITSRSELSGVLCRRMRDELGWRGWALDWSVVVGTSREMLCLEYYTDLIFLFDVGAALEEHCHELECLTEVERCVAVLGPWRWA